MNDGANPTPSAEPSAASVEAPQAPATPEASVPPEFVVAIPGRRPDDAPINLVVPDQEVADRVRQLVRSALRRDDYNRAMTALERQDEELQETIASLPRDPVNFYRRKLELDRIEQRLETDPIGFLLERVPPEIQIDLAKHLLSVPDVLAAVQRELEDWRDETVRAERLTDLRQKHARERPQEAPKPPVAPRVVKARRVS
jgi:hypothetical protein